MLESTTGFFQQNYNTLINRFFELFTQPFHNSELKWMIIPVVGVIIIMEVYWAKHKEEDTGWNTVTANSLVLVFISMDLFRFLSDHKSLSFTEVGKYSFSASILVLFLLFFGLVIFLMNFTHFWPKFFAYTLSSVFSVNIIAYLLLVIIYSGMALDSITLFIAVTFFLLINFIFFLLRKLFISNN